MGHQQGLETILRLLFGRFLSVAPVAVILSIAVFVLLRLSGDPTAGLVGDDASLAHVAAVRASLGLDKPIAVQFLQWLAGLVRGDFGRSLVTGQPVNAMVAERLGATFSLTIFTMVASIGLALPLGLWAARRSGAWADRLISLICVGGFSVPTFIVGYLLVWLFSVRLGWLPAQGYADFAADPLSWAAHLLLPTFAMSTVFVALILRVTRVSVIETLGQDYVRTARSLGAPERRVLIRFALRNAAVPIVTIIGASVGTVLTGVVVTETVFNLPGVGRLTIESVLARDFPVIQCVILMFACIYLAFNLAVDVACAVLDPRIRL